jgi:hypothetical protein
MYVCITCPLTTTELLAQFWYGLCQCLEYSFNLSFNIQSIDHVGM